MFLTGFAGSPCEARFFWNYHEIHEPHEKNPKRFKASTEGSPSQQVSAFEFFGILFVVGISWFNLPALGKPPDGQTRLPGDGDTVRTGVARRGPGGAAGGRRSGAGGDRAAEAQPRPVRPGKPMLSRNPLAARELVRVTPGLFALLRQAQQLNRETGGGF